MWRMAANFDLKRRELILHRNSALIGNSIFLNADEKVVNRRLRRIRKKAMKFGTKSSLMYNSILWKSDDPQEMSLLQFLRLMPKGGALNINEFAMCCTETLIKLTHYPNLWVRTEGENNIFREMKFWKVKPNPESDSVSRWWSVDQLRTDYGKECIHDFFDQCLTIYPRRTIRDNKHAKKQLQDVCELLEGLLTFVPVFEEYFERALEEFSADGVQYLEFRSKLPKLYNLDGWSYTPLHAVQLYKQTLDKFMQCHSDFIGCKVIYAPQAADSIELAIDTCIQFKQNYPTLFGGFDFSEQMQTEPEFQQILPKVLSMPDDIDFYLNAGDTCWNGSWENKKLLCAVLLEVKRIGHAFALTKHPAAMSYVNHRKISVEVNPVANKVMALLSDNIHNPASILFAANYPVVVSSHSPSFWRAHPLSHDFYIAYLDIAPAFADLCLLKQLCMNSLQFSAMSKEQKALAMVKWQMKWIDFIKHM